MTKRIFALLLAAVLLASLLPMTAMAAETKGSCGKGLTWSYDPSEATLTIGGEGAMTDYKRTFNGLEYQLTAPWSAHVSNITAVVMEDGVTSIGDYAFTDCSKLKSVTIPDTVTSIGGHAFHGCGSLTDIDLPENLTALGASAFEDCVKLKSIVIPDGVEAIEDNCFSRCVALTEVTLPEAAESIGAYAFYDCVYLTEVTIPKNVEVVHRFAFSECYRLRDVTVLSYVEKIKANAFAYCKVLEAVHYTGSTEEWAKVKISAGNEYLQAAAVEPYCDCGHVEVTVLPAVEVDCETIGLTEGEVCSRCGDMVKAQEQTPATGHDYEITVLQAPTCGTSGKTRYVCKNNEAHHYEETTLPTGKHSYNAETGICTLCGAKDPAYVPSPFADVAVTDYFFAPVLWAMENSVTGGMSENRFGPNQSCTRAQVVTFLWAANGKPEPAAETNPFTDVSAADYYYKPVLWAVEQGITGGTSATTFSPEAACTRAQVVTFLHAAKGKPAVGGTSTFSDVSAADWFAQPVAWAAENSVTGGIGNGMFGANNTCTRAQVVTFLHKVYG